MGFFSELRERRLVQIVVSYAAAGWIALAAFDQLADRGVLPDLAYYLALTWYAAGFLAALLLGWYHGEKGRQRVSRSEVALLSLIGVAGIAFSGAIVSRHVQEDQTGVALTAAGDLDARRIAILYLADMSQDRSLEYLADGLTEALIDELATVPSLDVVTKNGSLQFRDSDLSRDSIARALQAGTVVSGTVEDIGGRVRVDVSLADGQTGAEFRRGHFEQPTAYIFEIQQELAQEVSLLLREWLGEEVDVRQGGQETDNVVAWALMQRGERARKTGEDLLQRDEIEGMERAFEEADSLLSEAAAAEPTWSRPVAMRAGLALRRAQLSTADPLEAGDWIEEGREQVERALSLDERNAAALETRGMLKYLKWRRGLETDPAAASILLVDAEDDLNAAVRFDPTRANAWNVLSILHSQKPDLVEANIAARRAYEEDAYLRAAESILWRLYATSYDLEQFRDALQYCQEGRRRFPDNSRFVECQLWLLASRALDPDVERAWSLVPELERLTPQQRRDYTRLKGQIIVAGVLARAGLPDSANAVWLRSRGNPEIDPARELLGLEAALRLQSGQQEEALRLVKTYLTVNPEHRTGWTWTSHWWWRDLQDNPEFRDLVGSGPFGRPAGL